MESSPGNASQHSRERSALLLLYPNHPNQKCPEVMQQSATHMQHPLLPSNPNTHAHTPHPLNRPLCVPYPTHLRIIFTVFVKPSWQMTPGTVMLRLTLLSGSNSRTIYLGARGWRQGEVGEHGSDSECVELLLLWW